MTNGQTTDHGNQLREDIGFLKATDDIILTHSPSSAIMAASEPYGEDGVRTIHNFLHGWTALRVGDLLGELQCRRERYTLRTLRVTKASGSRVEVVNVPNPPIKKKPTGDILWRAADIETCPGAWSLAQRVSDDGRFIDIVLPQVQRIPRRLELMCLKYQIPPHVEHLPFEHQSFVLWTDTIVRPLRCRGNVIALYLHEQGCRARINLASA